MRLMGPNAALLLLFFQSALLSQEVVQCPRQEGTLAERWRWGQAEFRRNSSSTEAWIGYSIRRLMSADSYIGTRHAELPRNDGGLTLRQLITGDSIKANVVQPSRTFSPESRITKVLKDIAVLFKISRNGGDEVLVVAVELNDIDLVHEKKYDLLIWLGESKEEESLGLLDGIFDKSSSTAVRKRIVQAIGLHGLSRQAITVLRKIVESDASEDVRSEAVFWLSANDDREALQFVRAIVKDDKSMKVREQAVFALSLFNSDESTNELIDIAQNAKESRIRSKAAFWLGQKASEKATSALNDIIENDDDIDVQRQAVFALAQLKRGDHVEELIKIAQSHHSLRIRKEAVRLLGQSSDKRALDALVGFLRAK